MLHQAPKTNLKRWLRRRLQNLGVPYQPAAQVADSFQRQLDHRGQEGAVDYLKRVGDTLIWYQTGSGVKPDWVATNNGFPTLLLAINDACEEVLLRVAKFARSVRFDQPTQKQVDKVLPAVLKPYSGEDLATEQCASLMELGMSVSGLTDRHWGEPGQPPVVGKFWANEQSLSGPTKEQKAPPLAKSMEIVCKYEFLRKIPHWQHTFSPLTHGYVSKLVEHLGTDEPAPVVGTIHASQEGGGKLRMFAAPYTVVQCLLYPIHYWIMNILRFLEPVISTFNQEDGALWAQAQLKKGKTVYSVDLSTATCRFPLAPQLRVLSVLGLDDRYIDALIKVCRGHWEISQELKPYFLRDTISWQVGQPLGIAPSMSMFTLSHALLLIGICHRNMLDPTDSFRVLGDDVVINDAELHEDYRQILSKMAVPISEHKSHASKTFAEFAGYSITPKTMVRPGQWRQVHGGNTLALAEELQRPLKGEVSLLSEEIQKFHLFRLGLFSPAPEEWSHFIRVTTDLVTAQLSVPIIQSAKPWMYRIREEYNRQFQRISKPWRGSIFALGVPVFELDYEDPVRLFFEPLEPYMSDDVVLSFRHASGLWGTGNWALIAINAYMSALSLWERMLLSDGELRDLTGAITETVKGFLYLPPSKGRNKLEGLYRQYRKVLGGIK